MPTSPHFLSILERSKEIHKKKSQDYTTNPDENPFENFERSNIIASWFPDEYKSLASLIGVKLARLGALLTSGRAPENEAIDDTFLDEITYSGIMYAMWKEKQETKFTVCAHTLLNIKGCCERCSHYIADVVIERYYNKIENGFSIKPNSFIAAAKYNPENP